MANEEERKIKEMFADWKEQIKRTEVHVNTNKLYSQENSHYILSCRNNCFSNLIHLTGLLPSQTTNLTTGAMSRRFATILNEREREKEREKGGGRERESMPVVPDSIFYFCLHVECLEINYCVV